MGQTVNLLSLDFGGSNPSAPTTFAEVFCKTSESLLLQLGAAKTLAKSFNDFAEIAQSIEH